MDDGELAAAICAASRREAVCEAVHKLYESVEAEIALRRPICQISGRCCRFDEYGHRLYVTTMELAIFLHDVTEKIPAGDGKGCPYQINRLCTVRESRPMGCRLFFCDASSTQWQQEQYETFHAELKRLHERLAVPYAYLEWRRGLSILGEIER